MGNLPINPQTPILVEFSPRPGLQQASISPADLAKKSAEALSAAMTSIRTMAERVGVTMSELVNRPSELEVQFGLKLDADLGALLVKAGAEASLSVKLTWSQLREP